MAEHQSPVNERAPDVGIIPDSPAQRRVWDEIKATAQPSTATVLSDASGRWWHAFCARCGWRGQAAKDKPLIQARADQHNAEKHA